MSLGGGAYRAAGVDYEVLDAAKRRALAAAAPTLGLPGRLGARVAPESLGEPAALVEVGGSVLSVVLECLGTKSVIALEVEAALGIERFFDVGVDAVAAIVNDLCCTGALPVALSAYFATGSAGWYSGSRHSSLVSGWASACEKAGAAWVGGESPTLAGIIDPDHVDIAGSALGLVPEGRVPWSATRLVAGDEIVLVASGGLHANGASLARRVAAELVEGWGTTLPGGRLLGEALLDPSIVYAGLVDALHRTGTEVHYASHITGHGLRKLMRAPQNLTHRVLALPRVPEVLAFVVEAGRLEAAEAYGTFNMGAGFALFVPHGVAEVATAVARSAGYEALVAGVVEDGPRSVVVEPIGVVYGEEGLLLA